MLDRFTKELNLSNKPMSANAAPITPPPAQPDAQGIINQPQQPLPTRMAATIVLAIKPAAMKWIRLFVITISMSVMFSTYPLLWSFLLIVRRLAETGEIVIGTSKDA